VDASIGTREGGDPTAWARTPQLEAEELVTRLAAVTGVELRVEGACAGGEVGAAYVRWADGHRSVLAMGNPYAVPLVAIARQAGLPAPEYELVADLGSAFVVVQQLLPGGPPSVVDRPLLDEMVAYNTRMDGLLVAGAPARPICLFLRESGPGFCLHEPLAGYDRRTARVLDWAREVGLGRDTADGSDLVHMDYHPGNVLVHNGQITGIVDWDGAGRGDRLLDLVTLRFDLAFQAPRLISWLDGQLTETVPAERLRAYWAHMSVRLIDWAIRHHTSAEVDLWIATAERGMAALA
jgi:hypothetical protein